MKFRLFHSVTISLIAISNVFAIEAPLVQERFNEDSIIELVNGAMLGEPGSGVSGKNDDRAYVAPDSAPDDTVQPAGILNDHLLPQEMDQVTVTLWYKISQPPREATALVSGGGCYLLWQEERSGGWNMRLAMPIENKMRAWFNPRNSANSVPWNTAEEWLFYAFTWQRADGTAVVYQGTTQEGAREIRRFENTEAREPLGNMQPNVIIGNSYDARTQKAGTRAFGGSIDNVRIYGVALSAEDVEKVRVADSSNSPL